MNLDEVNEKDLNSSNSNPSDEKNSDNRGSQRPSRKSKIAAIQELQNMSGKKKKDNSEERSQNDEEEEEDYMEENEDEDMDNEIKKSRKRKAPQDNTQLSKKGRKQAIIKEKKLTQNKRGRKHTVGTFVGGGSSFLDKFMEGTLFEMVKQNKTPLSSIIDDWIEKYKQEKDKSLLELIQFIIHCCGCKGVITMEMYKNLEHSEIIRRMTEEFDEDSGDYPIIISSPQWRKFKVNFCEFISTLVHQCQYSIIYDQFVMDNIISLLTGMTDSQVRAFRHTSTLAAMKLMTSLVDVALNLSISLDHTQRQYEGEKSKTKVKQAQERLDLLLEKRKELEENQEEICHMLTYIFKGVFVHRYRDIRPEIRVVCMSEIGVWMKRFPSKFLDDSYLKYIGWTLYDKVGEVRLCCLKSLQPIYDTEQLLPKLELFTNRFKDRIVEMTLDKDWEVSVQAVKLLTSIFKSNESVLQSKDCEDVYSLIYSSHRALGQAAGQFFVTKLFGPNYLADTSSVSDDKGKEVAKPQDHSFYFKDVAVFFIESELHEHGAYLVDSLWDCCPMLRDWGCMTELLVGENKEEEVLDDKQETSIIELMVCCVKQAATGESPVGRGPQNKKLVGKELKQIAEDKSKLTEHFIVTLPQLLTKYTMHSEKISNLLNIPLHFDLEIYTTGRHEKQLDLLLRHIEVIVDQQSDQEVLLNCSKVLDCLCDLKYVIGNKCQVFKMTLFDQVCSKFSQASHNFFDKGSEPSEDDTFLLLNSLHRIYAFFNCHNLNGWGVSEFLNKIFKEKRYAPKEILCRGIACSHLSVFWQLSSLDPNSAPEDQLKSMRKRVKNLMERLCMLLKHPEECVQEEAFITICDILILFNKNLPINHPHFSSLTYQPDSLLQHLLAVFLQERVFIEEDEEAMDENFKIEQLHKRRNCLASFCKLIIYNVIKIKKAADVFKYYIKFYNDYGDIIKFTLAKARESNNIQTAKTLALSLTQLYTTLQDEFEDGKVLTNSDGFVAIKDLARRFSQSFGLDLRKVRNAIAAMHNDGILFVAHGKRDEESLAPLNISFLEILSEFSVKLLKEDKRVVLDHLDRNFESILKEADNGSLTSFNIYRHSLMSMKDIADHNLTAAAAASVEIPQIVSGKRKKNKSSKRQLPVNDSPLEQGAAPNTLVKNSRKKRSKQNRKENLGEEKVEEEDGEEEEEDKESRESEPPDSLNISNESLIESVVSQDASEKIEEKDIDESKEKVSGDLVNLASGVILRNDENKKIDGDNIEDIERMSNDKFNGIKNHSSTNSGEIVQETPPH